MGLYAELNIYRDWGFPEKTSWGGGILINYSEVIAQYAELMYQSMINKVPVRTGNLRHSLRWRSTNSGFVIETECEYAEYVEYGTCYMDAQPYFESSIEEYAEDLFEALKPIYNQAQSQTLRGDLDKEAAKAKGAEFGGGGFGMVSQEKSSGPKMRINWPKTGPFKQTPDGRLTASSWQASNPSMWRPGTRQHEYAVKLQAERSKYFDANGRTKPEYRPRVEYVYESSSSSSSGGGGGMGSFGQAFGMGMISSGDKAFDLSLSIGAAVGVSIAANGAGLGDIIAGALVGIVLTTAIYMLLLTLIDAVGMDPGENIKFSPIQVEVI